LPYRSSEYPTAATGSHSYSIYVIKKLS